MGFKSTGVEAIIVSQDQGSDPKFTRITEKNPGALDQTPSS